ncbi:MAG: transglutaminase family protein [Sphingomonadaceae bacterium]|nr:transglutaminase family protein [Sphingomonadaceae bacterium]
MHLAVTHTTRYLFSEPVVHALQRIRLMPKQTQGQEVLRWQVEVENATVELEYEDQHCNHVTLVSAHPGSREVVVRCSGEVATIDNAGVIGRHSGHLPLWSFLGQTDLTRPGPKIRAMARDCLAQGDTLLDRLHALSRIVAERITYQTGTTGVDTKAEDAALAGTGVCQDHAHAFIGAARAMDVPARYVSGYLMMNDRIDQDATHAWAEAHVDGLGWVGFDVSNGISPDPRYIRVATGRDYRDAAPVTGILFGAMQQDLHVSVAVEQQQTEQ